MTHPLHKAWANEWLFYMRSYMGGKVYKDGDYLIQHPFESSVNYKRRSAISYYYNYCGPIVDVFVSQLFRKEARRDFGSLSGYPSFESFLRDADLDGNTFRHFMRDAQRFASVYGRVSVIVDRPEREASTRAEAMENDIRPYLTLVTPENLLDWSFTRIASGRPVLDMVKVREGEGTYRVWRRDGWELWEAVKGDSDARLVSSGGHGLGVVPVVNLYNKKSGIRMLGISDLQDIADINKNIYYLCSDAKEIIENTAFPMLAVPYEKGGFAGERGVGPRNILQFDPEQQNSRPYWLEAPHSSLTEIREWVKQDINEIYRIARMGGVKTTEDFSQPRSGVALELEHQQLYAALSEKADNIEQAEMMILDLWARWEGEAFDGIVDYPDDFSVRDIERELDNAIRAQSARVDSVTFKRELQKKIASTALPKLDEDKKTRVREEIDSSQTP